MHATIYLNNGTAISFSQYYVYFNIRYLTDPFEILGNLNSNFQIQIQIQIQKFLL